jgi:hypothetical protein
MDAGKLKKFKPSQDGILLSFAIWICSLPLVGLVIMPIFGLKGALATVAALFIAAMMVCRDI